MITLQALDVKNTTSEVELRLLCLEEDVLKLTFYFQLFIKICKKANGLNPKKFMVHHFCKEI